MNNKNEWLMYKALAFCIFVILAVLIVLISVSTVTSVRDNTDSSDPMFIPTDTKPDDRVEPDDTDAQTTDTVQATDTDAQSSSDTTANDTTSVIDPEPDDTTSTPIIEGPPVTPPPVNITKELEDFRKKYPDTVLGTTQDAGQAYINKMVFLGDSTTYGLRAYSMLSGGRDTLQVWTPKSGTLTLSNASFATIVYPETNEEITIKEAVSRKKPEYLVITLGVNGVSFMGEDFFKAEYKKMLEAVKEASPDTKIICQSIFPVARSYAYLSSINNDKIRAANKWIVEVADEVGVKFIDTYSVLCDSEGWLPESYHNGDGIHLHAESFTLELNNLRTHAYTD